MSILREQTRLEKASAAQRLANTVCSPEVLGPLQEPRLLASAAAARLGHVSVHFRKKKSGFGENTPFSVKMKNHRAGTYTWYLL